MCLWTLLRIGWNYNLSHSAGPKLLIIIIMGSKFFRYIYGIVGAIFMQLSTDAFVPIFKENHAAHYLYFGNLKCINIFVKSYDSSKRSTW